MGVIRMRKRLVHSDYYGDYYLTLVGLFDYMPWQRQPNETTEDLVKRSMSLNKKFFPQAWIGTYGTETIKGDRNVMKFWLWIPIKEDNREWTGIGSKYNAAIGKPNEKTNFPLAITRKAAEKRLSSSCGMIDSKLISLYNADNVLKSFTYMKEIVETYERL